jgi:type III secretory pathway component EscV
MLPQNSMAVAVALIPGLPMIVMVILYVTSNIWVTLERRRERFEEEQQHNRQHNQQRNQTSYTRVNLQRRRQRFEEEQQHYQEHNQQHNHHVFHRVCPSALVLCSVTQSRKMQPCRGHAGKSQDSVPAGRALSPAACVPARRPLGFHMCR